MTQRTITTGNYPHTKGLKDGSIKLEGVEPTFVEVEPIHAAFAHMVREIAYDVGELAIATYLMARDNDIPVTLYPLVMAGNFHHESLVRMPDGPDIKPEELIGKSACVRAYSQTTGLWVRGVLEEDYGVKSDDLTWLTTEGPHVLQYQEPSFVKRSDKSLEQMLRDGDAVAGAMGKNSLKQKGIELVSIIPNAKEAQEAWGQKHKTVPANHMVSFKTSLLKDDPNAVRSIYQGFVEGIESSKSERGNAAGDRAIVHGLNDQLMNAVDLAITYCLQQGLITKKTSAEEVFADSAAYL